MITVHIITSNFLPLTGGLEQWTNDFATALLQSEIRPIVYVCEDRPVGGHHPHSPFEVVDIPPLRIPWEEPLTRSNWDPNQFRRERSRLNFACVKAEVAKRLSPGPNVIVSNFITTAGFTAHLVADALDLPHVPLIAGTDFTRGFRNTEERQTILEVCRFARVVVGKSHEQVRTISRRLPDVPFKLIETSVAVPTQRWCKHIGAELTIFSDGGFSFKKGTGILLDAFVALHAKGVAARLEICGSDAAGQQDYWRERRRVLESDPCLKVHFLGYRSRAAIIARICESDIYASATLGEGSSAARAVALCLGIPMVTTACGELAHGPSAAQVRLVPVGDAAAFHEALLRHATDLLGGQLAIDETTVDRFRRRFAPQTEWATWLTLLNQVTSND